MQIRDVRLLLCVRGLAQRLAYVLVAGGIAGVLVIPHAEAAESGASIYPNGFRDIYAGIVPEVPGFYVADYLYHYEGSASALVFNGAVQAGVEARETADFLSLTYVPKWKILGGTYAFNFSPSFVSAETTVGVRINPVNPALIPLTLVAGDNKLAVGDSAISPITLGWHAGNFYWAVGVLGVIPTGDYNIHDLANTSLNRWGVIPNYGITYLDPKTQWQMSSAFAYAISFENPATDYKTGDIFHNDSSITKNFGPLGVGVVGFAMIQTTPDSGSGAKLGANESRVYGVGPILTVTLGSNPVTALTLVAKGYHEFGAENTLGGNVFVTSASFKF